MSRKIETLPFETLKDYLPESTFPLVMSYISRYKVSLTITRARRSILGDYRRPYNGKGHRITVNGDLNPYAFLLTLLHELAHLLAFENYGHHIAPHGKEWKQSFRHILEKLNAPEIFPNDVAGAIQKYMRNPAARSCSDDQLVRTLRKYDIPRDGICLVEELEEGAQFLVPGGERFKRGRKLRKRYECKSLKTGHLYLFSPLYEVKKVQD